MSRAVSRRTKASMVEAVLNELTKIIHLQSPYPLYATLGSIVGTHFKNQSPVWLMLVGPPACGKSTMLLLVKDIPGMIECGAMSGHAAFISATRRHERKSKGHHSSHPNQDTDRPDLTGGILPRLGHFGILTSKDFTTVLSQNAERRAEVLAALREIADGSWTRTFGLEGGGSITWEGKAGFLGGVTNTIDNHYGVIQELGDRWVYWRYPHTQENYRATLMSLSRSQLPTSISQSIADGLLASGLEPDLETNDDMELADYDRLIHLAQFVSNARVSVRRNAFKDSEFGQPQVEVPIRVASNMMNIYRGMQWLSIEKHDRWKVLYRIAMDSIPAIRSHSIKALLTLPNPQQISAYHVSKIVKCGPSTATNALEDLSMVGIVDKFEEKGAVKWALSAEARNVVNRIKNFISLEEERYQEFELDLS